MTLIVFLEQAEEAIAPSGMPEQFPYRFDVLVRKLPLGECFIKHVVQGLFFVRVTQKCSRWARQQFMVLWIDLSAHLAVFAACYFIQVARRLVLIAVVELDRIHQTSHLVALWLILGEQVRCRLPILAIDHGVKQSQGHVHPVLLDLPLDLVAHRLQLLLQLELIDHLREVLHIVLVVHLSELFEHDKLVDG